MERYSSDDFWKIPKKTPVLITYKMNLQGECLQPAIWPRRYSAMGVFIEVLQVFVKFNTVEFGLRKVQELTADKLLNSYWGSKKDIFIYFVDR